MANRDARRKMAFFSRQQDTTHRIFSPLHKGRLSMSCTFSYLWGFDILRADAQTICLDRIRTTRKGGRLNRELRRSQETDTLASGDTHASTPISPYRD